MAETDQAPRRDLTLYDVARAIEENRIALNFQPIVRARDPRFVMFHEGLIRIYDYDGQLRNAGEFMDVVEGTEVGYYVDQAALELALERLRIDPAIRVSINMSTRTVWDEDWMFLLDGAARRDPSITERLIVEFTESSVLGYHDRTLEFMEYCRKLGVCFACDDFGSGYTVLGNLRDYQFEILKVDGQICQDLGQNPDNQIIMEAIMKIATHFDMMVVAEFIDNEGAAEQCRKLGVDGLQGFLYGKGEVFHRGDGDILQSISA